MMAECNVLQLTMHLPLLQKLVPAKTIKVYKTSAWPEPADCLGTGSIKTHLGKKSHVAQLNAAARYVATAFDWEVSIQSGIRQPWQVLAEPWAHTCRCLM